MATVTALVLGLCAACSPSVTVASGRCDLPPVPVADVSRGLAGVGFQYDNPRQGAAVSAVPGTRQAWALGGAYTGPGIGSRYLLRFNGLTWTRIATFGKRINLTGVSAVSGSAAWVWGNVYPNPHGLPHTFMYLALVSGGVVHPMRVPPRWPYVWPMNLVSHGPADTWLSGWTMDKNRRSHGPMLARWDGTAWHEVPVPATTFTSASDATFALATSGPANTWVADQRVWHWDGSGWSLSYTPPASQYRGPHASPGELSVASSAGAAWLTYNMDTLLSHDNSGPSTPYSAYFNGSGRRLVPVPRAFPDLAEVTMAGPDAWAMTTPPAMDQSRVLRTSTSSGWCPQPPLPGPSHRGCTSALEGISAASPTYVVAIGGSYQPGCLFAYVYDGHAWRPVDSRPVSQAPGLSRS